MAARGPTIAMEKRLNLAAVRRLPCDPSGTIPGGPCPGAWGGGPDALAAAVGLDEQPGKSNYLLGNEPSQWLLGIANYAQVQYQDVYPGVDAVYHGNQRQLEYDFRVAPGADPGAIRLAFTGA